MLVDVTKVKYKDNVHLADVVMFDDTALSDVLMLFGFGLSSNPMNVSKGFLLQGGHGNYFLFGVDDFKKQQAEKNEVVLYNDQASVRLTKDNKIEIKNKVTTLKDIQDLLNEFMKGVFNDFITPLGTPVVIGKPVIDPASVTTLTTKYNQKSQEIAQKIGGLLK